MRTAASALVAAALCVGGGSGPTSTVAADRLVAERAWRADAALAEVGAALERAVAAGRRGSARIVAGGAPPAPALEAAADELLAAEPAARAAARAVDALDAARLARDPEAEVIGVPVGEGELTSIAAQLEATAEAAEAFAVRRRAAGDVMTWLDRSLAAVAAGELSRAKDAVTRARRAHGIVVAWNPAPDTLAVWLETTDAMIGAVETILGAVRDGDADRARRAAGHIAASEDQATTADRALRIALSEGGNALAATPLGRMAGLLDAIAATRARVGSVQDRLAP